MSSNSEKKVVTMTKTGNIIAFGAAVAFAVISLVAVAQDDLDDLLKALEGESTTTAQKAEQKPEAPKAAESVQAEAPKAEEPAKAEEPKAEEPKAEESKAEEPKVDESKAEEPAKTEAPKA